jgi:hypothetical protein
LVQGARLTGVTSHMKKEWVATEKLFGDRQG